MKKMLLAIMMGFIPITTLASLDYDDALNSHNQEFQHLKQGVSNDSSLGSWTNNTNPPNNSVSVKMTSKTYHLNPPSDAVQTINLESTSTYTCAIARIGGYYGRGLKGFDARVYKSGSLWKMTVGKNCGGCDNWADAVCWRIQ